MSIFKQSIGSALRGLFGMERRGATEESVGVGFTSFGSSPFPYDGSRLLLGLDTHRAMHFSAVYAAIRLRSNTIASLPKNVYILADKGRRIAKEHPIFRLLKYTPNGFQNPFSFWNFINTCVDGWGNSYVIIRRGRGSVVEDLIPVHPVQVTLTVSNGRKWYRVFGTKQYDGLYGDDDMLHFYFYSVDGVKGVNPIEYNAGAIASGIGAQEFSNEYFEKKGNIRAVIETDEKLSREQADKFLTNFEVSKDSGNPLLTHGFKWKNITSTPDSSQMIESKTLSIQDVARIFMVPPHLLGDLSRSTFSNIEHQDIEFVKHYIRPTVKMYEQELDRKLLFDDERGVVETKFNLDGLMRGDMSTRADFYQKAVLSGWMSRNEAREMEYMNPVEGLDGMLYPSNENLNEGNKENEDNDEEE